MPQLPWDKVLEILAFLLIPALNASFVVMAWLRLVGRQRFAPLAAALALAAGMVVGNLHGGAINWEIPTNITSNWRAILGLPKASAQPADEASAVELGEPQPPPPVRSWLPWLAALAMAVELLVQLPGLRGIVGWIMRALVALLAGRLLTPPLWHAEIPAMPWILSGVILLNWGVLTLLARRWLDGTIAAALALCCAAAGVVLVLQADSARYMDMTLFCFAGLLGAALVAWVWPSDTSTALAAVAVFLPGLVLIGYHDISRDVVPSPRNFLLVALAPLALCPMLLPLLSRQQGWKRWLPGIILPMLPAVWAVIMVLQTESLEFE